MCADLAPQIVYTTFFSGVNAVPLSASQYESQYGNDPQAPQREAALFYGLFLRGQSVASLRKDIDVPKKLIIKLMQRHRKELALRSKLQQAYLYRKQVLAIFDELVTRERIRERVQ